MNEHLRYVTARLANLATSLETEARVAPELRSVGHESDLAVLSQRLKDALGALQMASNTAQLEILQATEVKLDLFQSQIEITTYTETPGSPTLLSGAQHAWTQECCDASYRKKRPEKQRSSRISDR